MGGKTSTSWEKGQSGNPKGRPPKSRALTALLEKAGSKTIDVNGKRVAGKRWLAQAVWEGVTTGAVEFPNEDDKPKTLELGPQDWLALMKWVYQHIDGPPKNQLELTGEGGGAIKHEHKMTADTLAEAQRRVQEHEQGVVDDSDG